MARSRADRAWGVRLSRTWVGVLMGKLAFTRTVVVGLALLVVAMLLGGLVTTAVAEDSGLFRLRPISGPLANATVSFGAWQTDPPLDRFPNLAPPPRNQHDILPNTVLISRGGAVNYIISGAHQVAVYAPGTRPTDIDVNNTVLSTGMPATLPLIADPTNRVYRGPDPTLLPRDRVEAVHFPNAGTYLVICAVRPHFVEDDMYGFVRVLP